MRCLIVLCLVTGSACAGEAPVPLVAAWNFDAGSKPTGGFPVEPQLSDGAKLVADGKHGGVLVLDGVKARAVLGPAPAFDRMVRGCSISLWFRCDAIPTGDRATLVSKRAGWWVGKPLSLDVRNDGMVQAVYNDGGWHELDAGKVKTGTWEHLALTISEKGEIAIYRDGKQTATTKAAGKLVGNGEPFVVGREEGGNFPGGNLVGFTGRIDELRFYAATLTAAQVAADQAGTVAVRPATMTDLAKRGLDPERIPAEVAQQPAKDAPLACSIDFSQEQPKAVGMWFDATGVESTTIEVDGRQERCFAARNGSAPTVPWARSLRCTLTDQRFREGRMPLVDVEVTYILRAWSGIDLMADLKDGSRRVGSAWMSQTWKTERFRLDDAFFAARDNGNADSACPSDGYDLRLNGYSEDLFIKSIKVIGYDLDKDVNWQRAFTLADVTADGHEVFAFTQGPAKLNYLLRNKAHLPVQLAWSAHLSDLDGNGLQHRTGTVSVTPSSDLAVPMTMDLSVLPLGVYYLDFAATMLGADKPLITRAGKIAIISATTTLGKAAPGTFLYALNADTTTPAALAWYAIMGVDLLRGGAINAGTSPEDALKVAELLGRQGVQVMPMIDPPSAGDMRNAVLTPMDPGKRAAALADLTKNLQAKAKAVAGKVTYWELGNEPDLLFFYRGPMEEYADSFRQMRAAIKAGDPKAQVMNGGLCFFGPDGDRRARELVSLLKPDEIDLWAIHGHGLGAEAERFAYQRIRTELEKHPGTARLPVCETESGATAERHDTTQLRVQARTCTQKLVYAQSVGMPFFTWFNLYMGGDAWESVEGARDPKPVVVAYRNTVERLRGFRFTKLVDLGQSGVEAYLFARGQDKVLVAWNNEPGLIDLNVQLDRAGAAIAKATQHDIYGNPAKPRLAGVIATITVGPDSTYLAWTSPGEVGTVLSAPSPLSVMVGNPVVLGGDNRAVVTVRNLGVEPVTGTLRLHATARVGMQVTPASSDLTIPPGTEVTVPVTLTAATADRPLRLPRWWRVFPYVDEAKAVTSLASMPASLPGEKGQPVTGIDSWVEQGRLDIGRIANVTGGFREKAAAVCATTVETESDLQLPVGACADWWMAWYVNGVKVQDTLATGNQGARRVTDYVFDLPLKKGRNTIAVLVLSGSGGWELLAGSSKELGLQRTGADPDRLDCTWLVGGKARAVHSQTLQLAPVLPKGPAAATPLEAWRSSEPTAVLGNAQLENFHFKHPDNKRWWQGDLDLSAQLWLRDAGDGGLTVVVAVQDTTPRPAAANIDEGDAIRLRLADGVGTVAWDGTIADAGGAKVMAKTGPPATATIEQAGGVRIYRVTIPKAVVPAGVFSLSLVVSDDDDGYLKQVLRLGKPENASTWPRCRIGH